MGAPLGNQYGIGHGRPPTFAKEQIEQFGIELLKWIKDCDADPNCNVVHLSEWYYEEKEFTIWEWDVLRKSESFFLYYDRAKKWLGRRTILNKNVKESYGNRFIGMYFSDLREHERQVSREKVQDEQEAKENAERRKAIPPFQSEIDKNVQTAKEMKIDDNIQSEASSFDPASNEAT